MSLYTKTFFVKRYALDDNNVSLSFKLEFPCSKNEAEHETMIVGLILALYIEIRKLCVLGDPKLIKQVSESDALSL